MRKVLFMLLLLPVLLQAQDKIEGIGKFKLKKTTIANLDSFAATMNLERGEIRSYDDHFNGRGQRQTLFEVFANRADLYGSPAHASYCKYARVFYLPALTVSGIRMEEIFFTFYRDTLVEIYMDFDPAIQEALELKYGKPGIEEENTFERCGGLSLPKSIFYSRWRNSDIEAVICLADNYTLECEKSILSFIYIKATSVLKKINACNSAERDRVRTKMDAEKKKNLDDF